MDEIADLIVMKGYEPLGTMKEFLQNSEIQEAKNEKIKTLEIVNNIIQDFRTLKQKVMKIKQEAENKSDYAVSSIMDNYLNNYCKKLWMLNECVK